MAGEVQITGLPELRSSLKGLDEGLRDLSTVNAEVANDLARAIASAAPRRTGRLAGSWQGRGTRDTAEAESTLDYAGPIEYGVPSRNVEGQHYAERALDRSTAAIESKYDAGVSRLCRKAES